MPGERMTKRTTSSKVKQSTLTYAVNGHHMYIHFPKANTLHTTYVIQYLHPRTINDLQTLLFAFPAHWHHKYSHTISQCHEPKQLQVNRNILLFPNPVKLLESWWDTNHPTKWTSTRFTRRVRKENRINKKLYKGIIWRRWRKDNNSKGTQLSGSTFGRLRMAIDRLKGYRLRGAYRVRRWKEVGNGHWESGGLIHLSLSTLRGACINRGIQRCILGTP